jgi:hypothetical protein
MIDAPDFGQVAKTEPYLATHYLGATRPARSVAASISSRMNLITFTHG